MLGIALIGPGVIVSRFNSFIFNGTLFSAISNCGVCFRTILIFYGVSATRNLSDDAWADNLGSDCLRCEDVFEGIVAILMM